MAVIFDTDILSAFAKTDNLPLLKKLFSKHDVYITPEIILQIEQKDNTRIKDINKILQ